MPSGLDSVMHQDASPAGGAPFGLEPDPRYLYRSASHGAAVDQLQQAIRSRAGFVLLTGEPGSGKTTICRAVVEQLDRRTFSSLVHGPSLSEEQLLRVVLQDFGLVSRDEMKRGRLAHATKSQLLDTLDEFLETLRPIGAAAVLIIDEAQDMPLENLEQIVALTGSRSGTDKPLQIVLVGRPILKDLLTSPLVRELDAKISTRLELQPVTAEETETYLSHRLNIAGGAEDVQFDPAAAVAVHRYSGGVPRLINMVSGNALSLAQKNGSNQITSQVVDTVAAKMELRPQGSASSLWPGKRLALVAGGILLTLVAVGIAAMRGGSAEQAATAPTATSSAPAAVSLGQVTGEAAPVPVPGAETTPAGSGTEPQTAAAAPAAGASFSVLVASFRQPREANALIEELRKRGLPVRNIRVVSSPRGVWHQVLVGPYADADAAARGREQVRQIRGYADAHVVPGQP